MSMLPHSNAQDQTESLIATFFVRFRLGMLLRQCSIRKESGRSALEVLAFLFALVFSRKDFSEALKDATHGKDVVYRFLNNESHNWRNLLWRVALPLTQWVSGLTSEARDHVLVIDDSLFSRDRSSKVELLSRIWDHADRRFRLGFRMLTLGWSDGNTFLPLAFSLLSTANPKSRLCEAASRDKRLLSYKRRQEGVTPMPDVVRALVADAVRKGVRARYILMDRWFGTPRLISDLKALGPDVICMVKKSATVKYKCQDGALRDVKQVYAAERKRPGRARILASPEVTLQTKADGELVKARIVFVRNRNKKRDWLALLCTDTTLTPAEAVRIYGRRWDIEVFFKCAKSHLCLAKEFHGRNYDALIAHTTIVMLRYTMLAVASRESKDPRTIGGIFQTCGQEMEDIRLCKSLQLLLGKLQESLGLVGTPQMQLITDIFNQFMASLPRPLLQSLGIYGCET